MRILNKDKSTVILTNWVNSKSLTLQPGELSSDFAVNSIRAKQIMNNYRKLDIIILSADEVRMLEEFDSRFKALDYKVDVDEKYYVEILKTLKENNPKAFIQALKEI